jgi:ParB family chromosome partitioning protein
VAYLPVDSLVPNPFQPRVQFDENALGELSISIKAHGIVQPLAAVKRGTGYMLVAGERRWRAARMAGLTEVPVILLNLTDQQMLECALVENLQRSDLNAIEEARAYKALMDTFGLSQEEVADRMGKSRPAIANSLRLLRLETEYQHDIEAGTISAGHARALLSLEDSADRKRLRDSIAGARLSVREAEAAAVEIANKKVRRRTPSRPLDPNMKRLRESLMDAIGLRVDIKPLDRKRGRIEIWYEGHDDLERLLGALGIEP